MSKTHNPFNVPAQRGTEAAHKSYRRAIETSRARPSPNADIPVVDPNAERLDNSTPAGTRAMELALRGL